MSQQDKATISRRGLIAGTGTLLPLALAGCGVLPKPMPPEQLYRLSPKSTFDDDIPAVGWQLGLEPPLAPAGLNSARIAVLRGELTMDYYSGAKWVDTAPSMVYRLLIESFENSGKIVGVGRSGASLRTDFELRTELREFQAEYIDGASNPSVRVRINCKLIKKPQRIILASEAFESLKESPDNRIESIVKTFDLALGSTMKRIVGWTLKSAVGLHSARRPA
ncbi:ABC-type transport auxiliary lipoprotein family protein [Nisaea acidiphila]|uniref:ABC-type transport auxiliary lipoprotein family protein n=1 Tax=Nisaea acidiphila TaxID=1862145 RepID=A0A9J7AQF8_9PROT|nr:ABC-type transport auxiliary lipoprotein family protein [Nisaea acidiphila]UUX49463.1 ABC-type transport auxiliary lipoprotein family protein [Nisaea acidiphila]